MEYSDLSVASLEPLSTPAAWRGLMPIVGSTLPETNIAHENPIFPGKYHQNGGFPMAMLVYRSVDGVQSWSLRDFHVNRRPWPP